MTLIEYTKLPGVSDLPSQVRAKFAQALKKEDEGDESAASLFLVNAIEAENQNKAAA
jgi:hypothetical protein